MPYNHGFERKQFEAQQRQRRKQYESAGMSEAEIQAIYQFDLAIFKDERRHLEHRQNVSEDFDSLPGPPLEVRPRLWWVEEIDDPALVKQLKALPEADLELLTLYAIEGFGQVEIAEKLGISQAAISKKLTRLKIFLRNLN